MAKTSDESLVGGSFEPFRQIIAAFVGVVVAGTVVGLVAFLGLVCLGDSS